MKSSTLNIQKGNRFFCTSSVKSKHQQRCQLLDSLVDTRTISHCHSLLLMYIHSQLLFSHFNFIHFISRDSIVIKFGIHSLPSTFSGVWAGAIFYLFLTLQFTLFLLFSISSTETLFLSYCLCCLLFFYFQQVWH